MKTIIDKNYKGVVKGESTHWFRYDNNLEINGDLDIEIDLIFGKNLKVNGYLTSTSNIKTCKDLEIEKDILIDNRNIDVGGYLKSGGSLWSGKSLNVGTHLLVNGDVTVGTDITVNNNASINGFLQSEGNTYIGGDLNVSDDMLVMKNLKVDGDFNVDKGIDVNGDITILKHKTNFAVNFFSTYHWVLFTNKLIKIKDEIHTAKEWESITDKEIKKMSKRTLPWWKKWKSFILSTHKELVKIYGEI